MKPAWATPPPHQREAARQFRQLGLTPALLTGDSRTVAGHIAGEVGVTDVVAEVLPTDKVRAVRRLQSEGTVVAIVGGVGNDAADLTVVRGDPRSAPDAIRLSCRTLTTIKPNLLWTFGYNIAAIPSAAVRLLNPMLDGAAMAFASVFVIGNNLRLRSCVTAIRDLDMG